MSDDPTALRRFERGAKEKQSTHTIRDTRLFLRFCILCMGVMFGACLTAYAVGAHTGLPTAMLQSSNAGCAPFVPSWRSYRAANRNASAGIYDMLTALFDGRYTRTNAVANRTNKVYRSSAKYGRICRAAFTLTLTAFGDNTHAAARERNHVSSLNRCSTSWTYSLLVAERAYTIVGVDYYVVWTTMRHNPVPTSKNGNHSLSIFARQHRYSPCRIDCSIRTHHP